MSPSQAYKPSHGGYPTPAPFMMGLPPVDPEYAKLSMAPDVPPKDIVRSPSKASTWASRRAAAIAGGLQEHSIGGIYPYHIVGRGVDDSARWELHDLQNGTIAIQTGPEVISSQQGQPRQWSNSKQGYNMAHEYAERVIAGLEQTEWA